jgi:hypothetical protein
MDMEKVEAEIVTESPNELTALAIISTAEIDQQVSTAKRYPRSIKAFYAEAMDLVTLTEEIAADCIFALPRGKDDNGKKKFIEGPSVRFSEIIASSWGNNRSGSRPMGADSQFVKAQGVFHDLEKNVAITVEVQRGITDKYGKRYKADMIGVTGNAACSIAVRNARLQGIPKAIWQGLYDAAKKTAIGDSKTLAKKRTDMMAYFQKLSVAPETIYEFMGVKGVEDIGLDELAILKGIATAIKEGTVSVDRAFITEEDKPTSRNAEKVAKINEAAKVAEPGPDLCPGEGCGKVRIEGHCYNPKCEHGEPPPD